MRKFRIKNRHKRKYTCRQIPTHAYSSLPFVIGLLPGFIIILAFITIPLLSFLPRQFISVPHALALFSISLITTILQYALSGIHETAQVTLRFVPHRTFAIPQYTLDMDAVITALQHILTVSIQTIGLIFHSLTAAFTQIGIAIAIVTGSLLDFLNTGIEATWQIISVCLKGFIGLAARGFQQLIFVAGVTIEGIAFIGKFIIELFLMISNFVVNIVTTAIIMLDNIAIQICIATLQGIEAIYTGIYHIIVYVGTLLIVVGTMIVSGVIFIGGIIFTTIFAAGITILHFIQLPFFILGRYLDAMQPYFSLLNNQLIWSFHEIGRNFTSSFSLFSQILNHYAQ